MKTILPVIAAMTLASAGAMAQQQNSAAQNDQQLSPQDFVQKVESGTHYEIAASQIAVRKTQDKSIRRFADRMVRDHSRAAAALEETIAADRKVDLPADTPMTADLKQKIDALSSASGDDFDNTYVQQMVDDHKQALPMFETYARDGSDPRLKAFARQTAPIVREHLSMVERMQKMESRASTPATTGRSSSKDTDSHGNQMSAPAPASQQMTPSNSAAPSSTGATAPAPAPAIPGGNSD